MKKRNSNMELLRIVAMVMIIAYHIFSHCINVQLTDMNSIKELENDWFCQPEFSNQLCRLALIAPMGQVGNAIFMLLTGYFMIEKKSIDLTKISKNLLLQLGFAAVSLGLISIYAYLNITEYSLKFVQFNAFNWLNWYVGYYFVILVVAKLFLNRFLNGLEQKQYAMFVIAIFALVEFSWSASLIANLGGGLELACTGLFLYAWGGYIQKYEPLAHIRTWAIFAVLLLVNLVVIGNFYIQTAGNISSYDPESGNLFIQYIPTYANNQIVPLLLGISLFELFRRIKMPSLRIINFLGKATLMVYLLHDNEFFYSLWKTEDWITLLYEDTAVFSGTYLLWILKTFAAGLLCYILFLLIGKLLHILAPLAIKRSEA